MKRILTIVISGLIAVSSFSQQAEHYTQYQFNQFAFNPAIAGTKKCVDIRSGYRFQWVGIDGAPQVGFANVHMPVRFSKRKRSQFGPTNGMGLQAKRDVFGPYSMLQVEFAYALHLPVSRFWKLSMGLSFGFKQANFNADKFTTELSDPLVSNAGKQSWLMFPDGKVGFWLSDPKTYFGLSVGHLFGNRFKKLTDPNNIIGTAASKLQQHIYFTAGRKWELEKKWSLIPSVFVLYTPRVPIDWHLSALFDLDNKFSMGIGLRRTDAITAQIRVKLFNLLSLGYSFDFVLSKLRGQQFHTHEITAGFNSCSSYGESGTTNCPVFE